MHTGTFLSYWSHTIWIFFDVVIASLTGGKQNFAYRYPYRSVCRGQPSDYFLLGQGHPPHPVHKPHMSSTEMGPPCSGLHPQWLALGLPSSRHQIDGWKSMSNWISATVLRLVVTTENREINPQGSALEGYCRLSLCPHQSALVSPSAFCDSQGAPSFLARLGELSYCHWVWPSASTEGNLACDYFSSPTRVRTHRGRKLSLSEPWPARQHTRFPPLLLKVMPRSTSEEITYTQIVVSVLTFGTSNLHSGRKCQL